MILVHKTLNVFMFFADTNARKLRVFWGVFFGQKMAVILCTVCLKLQLLYRCGLGALIYVSHLYTGYVL